MKKILLLIAVSLVVISVSAQEIVKNEEKTEKSNFVKINLLAITGGKYAFEYERVLAKKLAVTVAFGLRPENKLPFSSQISDLIDDQEINSFIAGMKTSGIDITPEVKFYLSKSGFGKGFYLAPYAKFANVDFIIPYTYDVNIDFEGESVYDREEQIELKGDLKTFTAGLSAGFNFKLAKNIFLDWKIIGPGYGQSKGDVLGKMVLNADEQIGLREQLGDLKESLNDLPVKIDIDYNVHNNGADIKLNKSPWASMRTGLSISYRF